MHRNSELLFRRHGAPYIKNGAKVLEIGPDKLPASTYRACCDRVAAQWDTIDLYVSPHLTYTATTPYNFPIGDDTYDVVLSGQVIEHVPRIWAWMREVARIIKPGGSVVTVAPCSWPYHEAPHDCWRIYPDGIRALVEDAGLIVEQIAWGSLEAPETPHAIPGRSFDHQPQQYRELMARFAAHGGFPVEKSFDTICVARKPGQEQEAWTAAHPRFHNIALGKAANQSSISEWSIGKSTGEDAVRAVNGLISGRYNSHTGFEPSPWWRVDLGGSHELHEIRIFNRIGEPDIMRRLSQLAVDVSDDAHNWKVLFEKIDDQIVGGADGNPLIRMLDRVTARYVRIRLLQPGFLHLDQVQIFGILPPGIGK